MRVNCRLNKLIVDMGLFVLGGVAIAARTKPSFRRGVQSVSGTMRSFAFLNCFAMVRILADAKGGGAHAIGAPDTGLRRSGPDRMRPGSATMKHIPRYDALESDVHHVAACPTFARSSISWGRCAVAVEWCLV